jgi:hypothetical protein
VISSRGELEEPGCPVEGQPGFFIQLPFMRRTKSKAKKTNFSDVCRKNKVTFTLSVQQLPKDILLCFVDFRG